MQKKIKYGIFLSCLLFTSFAYAQHNSLAISYKNFISTEQEKKLNANTYICKTSSPTIASYIRNKKIKVERQLDDSVFIVTVLDGNIAADLNAQPANNNWKFSPLLLQQLLRNTISYPFTFLVSYTDSSAFATWAFQNKIAYIKTVGKKMSRVVIKNAMQLNGLVATPFVTYAAKYSTSPQEEVQINNLDLSTNSINLLHNKYPLLKGDGLVVSIKENTPDTNDIDLTGRYIVNPLAATTTSPHANIMATMAAGAGNSWYLGLGVAKGAGITSSNFGNLLPDPLSNYQEYHISVQNHSYGVGVENFYGADANAFDATAISNDQLLLVFSAGNSGLLTPSTGTYAGIPGVANLTGSFKMAKNIITVGATDSFYTVAPQSSKGPAYDGRIKPEMVAYGEDGSSGAAALVSGTGILLQQAYKNNNSNLPPSALVKAMLLNSCDDVATPGIDFTSGFGSLNAYKAVEGMTAGNYFTGTIANAGQQDFSITVPANISKAKCTLVWNDIPAAANAFKALQNDLDISVVSVSSGQSWLPWVLNSSANSITSPPVRKRDSLNNIEQVSINDPVAGSYLIRVKGFQITNGVQPFAIAYQFDTASRFTWHFPGKFDNIFPVTANVIRWSYVGTGTGGLDYSIDGGNVWLAVNNNIDLATGYYRWMAPDTNALAQLRMRSGSSVFISDTFTISAKPDLSVGFNCVDSVLLYWTKSEGVSSYRLYGLGNKYLEPILNLSDTQFIFNKNVYPYQQFAVAPVLGNTTGIKSYTTNFATQGADCYVTNLLADLIDNHATLSLQLGTTYLVKKIVFEKLRDGNYTSLSEINTIAGLNYSATDAQLTKGVNTYRAAIYLQDGRILFSYTVTIFFFEMMNVIIYPNPVSRYEQLHIKLKELNNQHIRISDAAGRIILSVKATGTELDLPIHFPAGFYLVTVNDEETHIKKTFKLMVR